ncbi:hypothetical protein [Candidatus Kuenenia sp.]|uniref:hypothetical protein n=1 Tax=Candidatus Kuenenia sp. TaxID=2499824 RepID=UPI0032203F1E
MHIFRSVFKRAFNLICGGVKGNIFFLHVPKCGGVSISRAIGCCYYTLNIRNDYNLVASLDPVASAKAINFVNQKEFPYDTSDDYPILKFRENLLLYYMSQNNKKYIYGHFSFSEIAYRNFSNKYVFVTVLRNPIKRWISLYFFNRYKKQDHCKMEDDITVYLESKFGQAQGYEYVKFLGGLDNEGDYTSKNAINRAKNNIDKFDIVGFIEYEENFLNQFKKRFAVKLNIEKKNQSPAPESLRNSIITEEIEEKIREICRPDLEVYQYAIEKFAKINQ